MKIKKRILIILIIISTLINLYINPVQATSSTRSNSAATTTKQELELYSKGAVLMDASTGKMLYGKNENEKLYPASTTKILTAILAIENCKLDEKIKASYDAVTSIPAGYSNAAIQPDEILTCQELLDMFLIHSANEIGIIFAEHISGNTENFATLMNKKASELGCKNTHFTNPSGIHDVEHYSTAYDMALIAKYCMKNQTFRNIVSKVTCTIEPTEKYEKRFFRNTNDLIDPSSKYYYESAIGTKTGYTSQAKHCLISGSLKNNFELISVVLGADSSAERYSDTTSLFEYGYNNYKVQKIADKNTVIDKIVIENATKDTENLSLLLENDIIGVIPSNINLTDLDYSVHLNETISAPISESAILGKITYNIDGDTYTSNLIAEHSVEELNMEQMLFQIALALFVLFILATIFKPKKKSKKRKNYRKKSSDSIYKFY